MTLENIHKRGEVFLNEYLPLLIGRKTPLETLLDYKSTGNLYIQTSLPDFNNWLVDAGYYSLHDGFLMIIPQSYRNAVKAGLPPFIYPETLAQVLL